VGRRPDAGGELLVSQRRGCLTTSQG
jgi:hypothetical protein